MRDLLRQRWRYFLIFTIAGLALRLFFVRRFPFIAGDTFIYGEIALTWLKHGIYGMIATNGPVPTLIRVPGYPAFLALLFKLFGPEHYGAAMYTQIAVDLATCFVIADLARRMGGRRVAVFAFAIAALCPFTAHYVATPLTETLVLFFTALAFDLAVAAFAALDGHSNALAFAAGCGLAIAAAIYLRPDSGILLIAIGLVLMARLISRRSDGVARRALVLTGAVILLASLVPLAPWTIRNWRTFHVFQPIAPFSASDPDEPVQKGFTRWVHTWIVEYASLEDFAFNMPGSELSFDALPRRACDTQNECDRVRRLIDEYNGNDYEMTDATDAAFGQLAAERVAAHRVRTYVWLPLLRTADLWLRPRIEMLPLDIHWWDYKEDPHDSAISLAYAALNLLLLIPAVLGMLMRPRYAAALLVYIIVRTLFLTAIGAVESRYTIECYPAVIAFAAYWLATKRKAQPYRLGAKA